MSKIFSRKINQFHILKASSQRTYLCIRQYVPLVSLTQKNHEKQEQHNSSSSCYCADLILMSYFILVFFLYITMSFFVYDSISGQISRTCQHREKNVHLWEYFALLLRRKTSILRRKKRNSILLLFLEHHNKTLRFIFSSVFRCLS